MTNRAWHPNFQKYVKLIVAHKNYNGLFYEIGEDDQINWVITGESEDGQKRKDWWNKKCKEFGIKIEAGCYAVVARLIHPTKYHTCQICGKELSIKYIYPNKRLISKLDKEFNIKLKSYVLTVFEIIDKYIVKTTDINRFAKLLNIKFFFKNVNELKDYINKEFVNKSNKSFLSPGVMSNSPDRFDGFHSDGACCRSESDKGRHKSNLSRYNQDRRAYEYWSDGDWKMADRLMAEFSSNGVSADHIGPISLGFCHRAKFQPMTGSANSAKGNRMSLLDVQSLLKDEKSGEQVVSWHSKYVWDLLKNRVKNNQDALELSKIMKNNLHWVLTLFAIIDENGGRNFLVNFLNPEYSFFDHKFEGFNPKDGTYKKIITIKKSGKNQKNNIDRSYRIAFYNLRQYKEKTNRWHKIWKDEDINCQIEELLSLTKNKLTYKEASKLLNVILKRFSTLLF